MVTLLFWLSAGSYADVVGPDATGCPRGSVGTSNHGGAFCTPRPECTDECQDGERCASVGLCILEEERPCGGMTDPSKPCTYTHVEALGSCSEQGDCATGTCVVADRCMAAGCGGCDASGAVGAWVFWALLPLGLRRRHNSVRMEGECAGSDGS